MGLGALGVVAEVTLRCVPPSRCSGIDAPAPLEETLERFEELALGNEHFEFFVFPHCDVALTRTNNRTEDAPAPARARRGVRGRRASHQPAVRAVLPHRTAPAEPHPEINRLVTRLAGSSKRIDRSDRIFASPRLVRFTEMEYALPREHTTEAVRSVMETIERRGFAVPFPIEVRTVAADDALLSTAAGRESGYVAVHMYRGMQWRPYFEAVEQIMDSLGGPTSLGQAPLPDSRDAAPRYPEWDRFQAVRARLDPEGRFANAMDRSRARSGGSDCSRAPLRHAMTRPDGLSRRVGRQGPKALGGSVVSDPRLERLERATAELEAPFAAVDLDAFWGNAADMERRAARQADPPGEQVGALPSASGACARAPRLPGDARVHAARGAVAGRAWLRGHRRGLPHRRP